jgi:hypothetical protein
MTHPPPVRVRRAALGSWLDERSSKAAGALWFATICALALQAVVRSANENAPATRSARTARRARDGLRIAVASKFCRCGRSHDAAYGKAQP